MGFLNAMLRREAEVFLNRQGDRGTLGFRYGGGLASFADVRARWPELAPLEAFVDDPGRLSNAVGPDRLPALLAASIGPDGTDMSACERAHDCFCINTAFRERWNAMKAAGRLFPGQVEDLFTAMILHYMEVYQRKQPERNLFA